MTGFEDLDEATQEQSADATEEEEQEIESDPAPTMSPQESTESSSRTVDLSDTDPAFPFDEAIQAQIYPRRQTHEEFTDFLDIEVKRLLRQEGIRNEAGRELHEAVLRVAMNHPEEITKELARQRSR